MDNKSFGQILRMLRHEKGLTQIALSKMLNVTDRSIRDWENENIEPSYATLGKLIKIFDVTAGQLLGFEEY
ncbi:MAG: helix-turn-helix domain-containing protein [Clostridiales bacterium]|jgi:transcriptional regulator with XRE-family HTH domain|nr:helix-turn-helix domain-containing protein [Clostridiales bacterium]